MRHFFFFFYHNYQNLKADCVCIIFRLHNDSFRLSINQNFTFTATDVCSLGSDSCDRTRSACTMTINEDEDFYKCDCADGYVSNTTVLCHDYCQARLDNCDPSTTDCVATPGVGANFQCNCKTGYNRVNSQTCTLPPTTKPTTGSTDGKIQTTMFFIYLENI